MSRLNKNYFFISTLFHITVFFLFCSYFEFSKKIPALGNSQATILNSYIYSGHFSPAQTAIVKQSATPQKKPLPQNKQALKKVNKTDNTTKQPATTSMAPNSISFGEQTHAFIALLHDAIQKEQQYPPSALQMGRHGRVTVAFTLLIDGTITNLRILSTSGTSSLDSAALSAVNHAAPFHQLKKYLQKAEEYQIDIVFELT